MKKLGLALLLAVSMTTVSLHSVEAKAKAKVVKPAPRIHAICKDKTVSYSVNRKGTCSHHKGVLKWMY